jgi:succinate dehydrogenase/fumarate reductase flavoprotein subunit
MDQWKVGWAREDGHIRQALAPGHDRPRCVYVDFLSTGPAVSRTLRAELNRIDVRRIGDIVVTDIATADGVACGAVGFHLASGEIVAMAAKAVIIATGGLTRLYARNSASANMGGDGFGLALRAGVELIDMEFVQFFPIGHLAPRLIGMDPIMWDPFRYKLGGRLLNADGEEFADRYGQSEAGSYTLTRDVATYAIFKEVEAGRGSPAGGAYLSFTHVPEAELRRAFGPVIDRLARNGIDLTQRPIEVAPIAHYHMGGIRVDASMETGLPGLFAAGEAVGGANGANRLSGNAITEALVFGHVAGAAAAAHAGTNAASPWRDDTAAAALDLLRSGGRDGSRGNLAALVAELQPVPFAPAPSLPRHSAISRGSATPPAGSRRRRAAPMTPSVSTGSTCATCCWSPNAWCERRSPARKAAARISAKISSGWSRIGRSIRRWRSTAADPC